MSEFKTPGAGGAGGGLNSCHHQLPRLSYFVPVAAGCPAEVVVVRDGRERRWSAAAADLRRRPGGAVAGWFAMTNS